MTGLGMFEEYDPEVQKVSFPSEITDAFSRLRVSNPDSMFDAVFKYDKQPLLFWESTSLSATITHLGNNPSVELLCSTTNGSSAVFQTRNYLQYSPGKSLMLLITGSLVETKTGVTKRLGYFSVNDGVFFELSDSTLSVVRRTKVSGSVVNNTVNQSSWNLDKLDGTGTSGITVDVTKQLIFVIDLQWLGSGRIRFGFSISGSIVYCHEILNSNILTTPYSRTGKLPIRFEISNASTSSSTLRVTCISAVIEGGAHWDGIYRTVNSGTTPISFSSSSTKPIISLRKKSANIEELVQLLSVSLFSGSSDDFLVSLIKNPTLTGASWVDLSGYCQKDVSATALSGGIELYSDYIRGSVSTPSVSGANDLTESIIAFIGDDNGTSEILTLAATNLTTSASAYGRINYLEYL